MMFLMKVLVVVLNYNGADETAACLAALAKQTYRDLQLYLVENSTHDKPHQIKILRDSIAKHKLTVAQFDIQKHNTGFAGGVNLGIKYAMQHDFEAVALLNSDAIADKNWLKELAATLAKSGADAATGLMLERDGKTIINTADTYSLWGIPEQRDEGKPRNQSSAPGHVFGATGGATLYKTTIFRKIGLFDEKLFAYDEDIDLAWRANLAGFNFYYNDKAIVFHAGGTSSNSAFKTRQVFANLPVVVMKDIPRELIWRVWPRFILAYLMFFGYKLSKGDGWSALRGIGRSIRFWPHSLSERRRVQQLFHKKFSTRTRRQRQLHKIYELLDPSLPFKQIQRVKRFFSRKTNL